MLAFKNVLKSQGFLRIITIFIGASLLISAPSLPAFAATGSLSPLFIAGSSTIDLSSNDFTGITYGYGLFVATTNQGDILTSPDGLNWTLRYAVSDCALNGIAYGNGIFVAVGVSNPTPVGAFGQYVIPSPLQDHGMIMTSKDGVTWAPIPDLSDLPVGFQGVAYGNGTFVAVGFNVIFTSATCAIVSSTDGVTWARSTLTNSNYELYNVCFGDGKFVVQGIELEYPGTTYPVMTSPDGIAWTSQQIPVLNDVIGITCNNGLFVATGTNKSSDQYIATSQDGLTWTIVQNLKNNTIGDIAYGDGFYVATGVNVNRGGNAPNLNEILTSSDGANWDIHQQGIPYVPDWALNNNTETNYQVLPPVGSIAFGNNSFVAVGDRGLVVIIEVASAPANAQTPVTQPVSSTTSQTTVTQPVSSTGQQGISFIVGQSSYSVSGETYAMDGAPFIENGRTLVPIRYLADALGATTSWDATTQAITITHANTTVGLVIGSTSETTNGTVSQMDVAPVIENGRTYLPARYVAQAFGYSVSWDAQTINIMEQ